MKKILIALFFFTVTIFANECLETATKIVNIQNSIVQESFKKLKKGAWAKYSEGSYAIYLGESKKGKLYGIEFQPPHSAFVFQIWYSIVPKKVSPLLTMYTLNPVLLYFKDKRGHIFKIKKSLIELYMDYAMGGRENLSTSLTPSILNRVPNCKDKIEIKNIKYEINHNSIDAFKIVSLKNGASVIVSKSVPFGILEWGDKRYTFKLIDFGLSGKKAIIDEKKRHRAKEFSIPLLPKGFR